MTFVVSDVSSRRYSTTDRRKNSVFYFNFENETVLDDLLNRHYRPTKELKALLPEIKAKLNIPETATFRWSQKAGCRCGCSPGFVSSDYKGIQAFVHVSKS